MLLIHNGQSPAAIADRKLIYAPDRDWTIATRAYLRFGESTFISPVPKGAIYTIIQV